MPLGMEVGLGAGKFVLDRDPAPLSKQGAELPPQKNSAHAYCDQTAGWIKIVLGTKVALFPGDLVVLDGDPVPVPKKGAEPPPQFSVHFYCGQTAGWIKIALGMEVGLNLVQATLC